MTFARQIEKGLILPTEPQALALELTRILTNIMLMLSTLPPPYNDWDGDGKADLGIVDKVSHVWNIQPSTSGIPVSVPAVTFGSAGDIVVPGDYDGDGKTDVAVYRPSTGQWFILTSSSGFTTFYTTSWGGGVNQVPITPGVVLA